MIIMQYSTIEIEMLFKIMMRCIGVSIHRLIVTFRFDQREDISVNKGYSNLYDTLDINYFLVSFLICF